MSKIGASNLYNPHQYVVAYNKQTTAQKNESDAVRSGILNDPQEKEGLTTYVKFLNAYLIATSTSSDASAAKNRDQLEARKVLAETQKGPEDAPKSYSLNEYGQVQDDATKSTEGLPFDVPGGNLPIGSTDSNPLLPALFAQVDELAQEIENGSKSNANIFAEAIGLAGRLSFPMYQMGAENGHSLNMTAQAVVQQYVSALGLDDISTQQTGQEMIDQLKSTVADSDSLDADVKSAVAAIPNVPDWANQT